MSSYRVDLAPQEPFFFGNEKSAQYPVDENDRMANALYYLISERLPSQTTLFGALRYLLLPHKHSTRCYSPEELEANTAAVGSESFDLESERKQSFGALRAMSPLFLFDGTDRYIITPFDHRKGFATYTPFTVSPTQAVQTLDGEKDIAVDYDAKQGLDDSFLRLRDRAIVPSDTLFSTVTRVGINRRRDDKGFFKKDFMALKDGFSFSVYVELDDRITPADGIVYLGQNRSMFTAHFTPEDNTLASEIAAVLPAGRVYCAGDLLADSCLYAHTRFAATRTRDHRAFTTCFDKQKGTMRIKRSTALLLKAIRAGSVLIPRDKDSFLAACQSKSGNPEQIGFNTLIVSN